MRAIEPRQAHTLEVAGYRIAFEDYGAQDAPPLLLLPCWQIAPSKVWKMQVPYLARSHRVIAWDPPGIGGGERTTDPAAFEFDRVIDYGIGLLDYLDIERTSIMGFSLGGAFGLWMAACHPERVERAILIASARAEWASGADPAFWEPRAAYAGWEKRNANYWREDFPGWLEFFFGHVCSEPHSSKMFDDLCSWAMETTPEILIASIVNRSTLTPRPLERATSRVECPVLLIHGTDDRVASVETSREIAALRPDVELVEIAGGGHTPQARDPVRVNLEIDRFLGRSEPVHRTWPRAAARHQRRALFISSPIGLGHVHRDLAIARELRALVPDLQIDWLAQSPVTSVLERAGERIHPMSAHLASESAHWEEASSGHELHCFQAFREMDEILLANFMVFLDAATETPYDLWYGDEAWDVDHYLHENPELKSAPYVFLTDFLGWLPMDRSEGSREAWLTADYNLEMITQIDRYPRIRDLALYIGDFDDLVPERFGPDLPVIPEWAEQHFTATGYITPFNSEQLPDRAALRRDLGYQPDKPLILFAVGGTAVGKPLLDMVLKSWPLVHAALPDAQGVVVAGPRIDPSTLESLPGLTVTGYVHELYHHLAAADLAVVQGGLSTTMELTAARTPFIYFPLKNHCEQVFHVAHRLERYNAGHRMWLDDTTPEILAQAMLDQCGADTSAFRPVAPGAARRAAGHIARLL